MTDDKLKAYTREFLQVAKANKSESQAVLCVLPKPDGKLQRMASLEKAILMRFGQEWLDDDGAKSAVFDLIRLTMNLARPAGIFISTPANMFKPSKLMKALSPEQFKAALDRSRKDHAEDHKMVAEGLFIIQDSLWAIGQTPEKACIMVQAVASRPNGKLLIGEPDIQLFNQTEFGGRMKMFHEKYDTQDGAVLARIIKSHEAKS